MWYIHLFPIEGDRERCRILGLRQSCAASSEYVNVCGGQYGNEEKSYHNYLLTILTCGRR